MERIHPPKPILAILPQEKDLNEKNASEQETFRNRLNTTVLSSPKPPQAVRIINFGADSLKFPTTHGSSIIPSVDILSISDFVTDSRKAVSDFGNALFSNKPLNTAECVFDHVACQILTPHRILLSQSTSVKDENMCSVFALVETLEQPKTTLIVANASANVTAEIFIKGLDKFKQMITSSGHHTWSAVVLVGPTEDFGKSLRKLAPLSTADYPSKFIPQNPRIVDSFHWQARIASGAEDSKAPTPVYPTIAYAFYPFDGKTNEDSSFTVVDFASWKDRNDEISAFEKKSREEHTKAITKSLLGGFLVLVVIAAIIIAVLKCKNNAECDEEEDGQQGAASEVEEGNTDK